MKGLLREISTIIADAGVNISEIDVQTRHNIATLNITVEITDNQAIYPYYFKNRRNSKCSRSSPP